jgi:hypothetical protein
VTAGAQGKPTPSLQPRISIAEQRLSKIKAMSKSASLFPAILCQVLGSLLPFAEVLCFCTVRPEQQFHDVSSDTLEIAELLMCLQTAPQQFSTDISSQKTSPRAEPRVPNSRIVSQKHITPEHTNNGTAEAPCLAAKKMALEKSKEAVKMMVIRRATSMRDTFLEPHRNHPYFINLDPDHYHRAREVFLIDHPEKIFGLTEGCFMPTFTGLRDNHCCVTVEGGHKSLSFLEDTPPSVYFQCLDGLVLYNGKIMAKKV